MRPAFVTFEGIDGSGKTTIARRVHRELRKRGISRDLAWNTAKSAHGPWRLSASPVLAIALPARYFAALGLPSLVEGGTKH